MQEDIAQRQKEKMESMASYASQMKMLVGGIQSTIAHMMFSAPTIDVSKRYVLVVEDNNMISQILEITLKEMGYHAILAENGKIAVEKFTNFMKEGVLFELILMDIIMPEMGGYEATQLIRKVESEYNLSGNERHFISGFSAQVSKEIEKKCHDCGMNTLIAKPIKPENLKQMLDENRRISNIIGDENMGSKNTQFDHIHNG